jgi:hypothetical protein
MEYEAIVAEKICFIAHALQVSVSVGQKVRQNKQREGRASTPLSMTSLSMIKQLYWCNKKTDEDSNRYR